MQRRVLWREVDVVSEPPILSRQTVSYLDENIISRGIGKQPRTVG